MATATNASAVAPPAFDIWGPLQRRRYLVVLFCVIGAGFGFLHYHQSPKQYSSTTRLMITTQAPPSIVDGDVRTDQVALSKHASLIASDLVLGNATRDGSLADLKMFKETSSIVRKLKKDLIIDSEADDVLTISCLGPNPDELPIVLSQVIEAYETIVAEDSRNIGQQTVEMIEKLHDRLVDDKHDAERRRLALWKELGIKTLDNFGHVENPHDQELAEIQQQQASLKRSLTEARDRARMLEESVRPNPETGEIDPIQIKIAAIEAAKYLKLTRATFKEEQIGEIHAAPKAHLEEIRQMSLIEQRIFSLESKVNELQFERTKLSDVFGAGHSRIAALSQQIDFYRQQLKKLQSDERRIAAVIDQGQLEASSQVQGEEMDLETFRAREDRQWVNMYYRQLNKDQQRLAANLATVETEMKRVSDAATLASEGIMEINMLQKQIDKKDQAVSVILERLSEMNILAQDYTTTKIRVLDDPQRGSKVAPSMIKSMGLGSLIAFLVGLGFAILVDRSEFAYHSPAEIFERLQVPVVGKIPRINTRQIDPGQGHASLIAAHQPSATAAESFRDVRTALFFQANHDDIKTILFTSPSPGDGKSTTISNLAISIAQTGKKVILIDADFRRPRVHQYFGQDLKPGLMDVLSGDLSLEESIQSAGLQANLDLLPAGGRPGNPGELVTSEALRNLIKALREQYDYVLIDSPPVLPVSDPAAIASMVDGVYLVTRIRKGVKLTSLKAKETLDRVGANWMGVIVNGLDENPYYTEYGYQYGVYSYYGGMYGRYYDSHSAAYRERSTSSTSA